MVSIKYSEKIEVKDDLGQDREEGKPQAAE
jgi:hypothetical protein